MREMFFSLIKTECSDVSCSVIDSGILEFKVPYDFDRNEIKKYLGILEPEVCDEIIAIQHKEKEKLRKKINKMIDKYKKEFNLWFDIKLRFKSKSKNPMECNLDKHGVTLVGTIIINPFIQYYSDEILEKIIRYTVSAIAIGYEKRYSNMKDIINADDYMPNKSKYAVPVFNEKKDVIGCECIAAVETIYSRMQDYPIMAAFID